MTNGTDEQARLELRYRRVLAMLPAWYREDREDEMVATFLADRTDALDLEYSWPGWRETAAVAGLAVRARFAGDIGPADAVARGVAVRLIALVGLLAYGAGALGWHAAAAVIAVTTGGASDVARLLGVASPFPFAASLVALVAGALTVGAFVALVAGRWGVAKGLGAAGFLAYAASQFVRPPDGTRAWDVVSHSSLPLLLGVPVLCLLIGFHREAPPIVRPRRWLAAFGAAAALVAVVTVVNQLFVQYLGMMVLVWAYAAGTAYMLRVAALRRSASWMGAVAICGFLVSGWSVQALYWSTELTARDVPQAGQIIAVVAVQAVLAIAGSIAAAVAAAAAFNRLRTPALPTPAEPSPGHS